MVDKILYLIVKVFGITELERESVYTIMDKFCHPAPVAYQYGKFNTLGFLYNKRGVFKPNGRTHQNIQRVQDTLQFIVVIWTLELNPVARILFLQSFAVITFVIAVNK